jgi:DNA-binding NarL/FixJ family response regulator
VGEATNGDSAIESAATLQPDFVLLDLSMPLLDGASALKELLRAAPNTSVIIVSGAKPSSAEGLLASGATAFVPKGIAPHDLLMRLGSILGRWVDSDSPIGWEEIDRGGKAPAGHTKLPESLGPVAVIYDNDPTQRQAIVEVVERCHVTVIAETDMALTLFTIIDLAQPDFVVLDLSVKGDPSVAVLAEVRRRSPRTVTLVYSDALAWREPALAAGAAGFVLKPQIDLLSDRIGQLARSSEAVKGG